MFAYCLRVLGSVPPPAFIAKNNRRSISLALGGGYSRLSQHNQRCREKCVASSHSADTMLREGGSEG